MVNMPPISGLANIAAVVGHGLQIKAGTQAFGGNGLGDSTAVALVEDAVTRYVSRLLPEATQTLKVAKKIIQAVGPSNLLGS
jgi:hypothetical protein